MGDGLEQPVPFSAQVQCCGWVSFYNWTENAELMSRINITYPCSCENKSKEDNNSLLPQTGFCEAPVGNGTQSSNNPDDWPVYKEVRAWPSGRAGLGAQWVQTLSPPGSPGLLLHRPFFTELYLPLIHLFACHLHLHLCFHQCIH